ncbi:MAG: hypothetical protein NPIRA05_04120 [Nitrospirales bacterium]|nr:MAG: hypothetical protein NPIRA05_04120 [Nitrospirales bacterium]
MGVVLGWLAPVWAVPIQPGFRLDIKQINNFDNLQIGEGLLKTQIEQLSTNPILFNTVGFPRRRIEGLTLDTKVFLDETKKLFTYVQTLNFGPEDPTCNTPANPFCEDPFFEDDIFLTDFITPSVPGEIAPQTFGVSFSDLAVVNAGRGLIPASSPFSSAPANYLAGFRTAPDNRLIWYGANQIRPITPRLTSFIPNDEPDLLLARGEIDFFFVTPSTTPIGMVNYEIEFFEELPGDIGTATALGLGPVQPIPEPSTVVLLGTGLAGLTVWRRKRYKNE